MRNDPARIKEILERNVTQVIDRASLEKKLSSGKKLRIKLGCDPTSPDLHLGHAVHLWKLKEFQDLGHQIVFIIGDFTASIGDPSDRANARPMLETAEIKRNAKTYFEQVGKILDLKKVEVRKNSEWLGHISLREWLKILERFTVSQLLERDDFQKRLTSNQEVWMHEVMYPLLQGYDSVAVKADVELGAGDQLFNLLMGRTLQEKMGQLPQDVLVSEYLVGLDGEKKMSKSSGNYIGVAESPRMMFGKVMSIPDGLIVSYFRLATRMLESDVKNVTRRLKSGENPRDVKLDLARAIVELYYGRSSALREQTEFVKVFSKKELPSSIKEITITKGSYEAAALLLDLKLAKSKSEAKRLIEQGGVEIIPPTGESFHPKAGTELISANPGMVIRVGKTRFLRLRE